MSNKMSSYIGTFLKDNGITGNPVVDGLILANLVPLAISYMNTISGIFMKFITFFWQLIVLKIKNYTYGNIVGQKLGTIVIKETNDLYQFVKEHVFTSDLQSENINRSTLLSMIDCVKMTDQSNINQFKQYHKKHQNIINVDLSYNDDADLKYSIGSYFGKDKEKKYFKHDEYMIIVIHQMTDKQSSYKFKLRYCGYDNMIIKNWDNKKSTKLLENFLQSKFNFSNSMHYVYNISFPSMKMYDLLRYMLNNGTINSRDGLLKYGDKYIGETDDGDYKAHKNMVIDFYDSNLNTVCVNYKKTMSVVGKQDDGKICRGGFYDFVHRYIKSVNSISHYGYFQKDGCVYLIYKYNSSGNYTLSLISLNGMMTMNQIKERMSILIRLGLNEMKGRKDNQKQKEEVKIYKRMDGKWSAFILKKRCMDTIFLPNEMYGEIRKAFDDFIVKERVYKEYQIPYKKGILFYGPPGTGKTSLVKALAFEYQMDIYIININDEDINDDTIVDVLNSIGNSSKKIILFEDIDTAFAKKEQITNESREKNISYIPKNLYGHRDKTDGDDIDGNKDKNENKDEDEKISQLMTLMNSQNRSIKKYLTYSGLLNALDGVMSNQHGVITIMTTNYVEKLGDAFLRPGRIDSKFELKECNDEQIRLMITVLVQKYAAMKISQNYDISNLEERINRLIPHLVDEHGMSRIKPCALQFYILKYIDNIDAMFSNFQELEQQ